MRHKTTFPITEAIIAYVLQADKPLTCADIVRNNFAHTATVSGILKRATTAGRLAYGNTTGPRGGQTYCAPDSPHRARTTAEMEADKAARITRVTRRSGYGDYFAVDVVEDNVKTLDTPIYLRTGFAERIRRRDPDGDVWYIVSVMLGKDGKITGADCDRVRGYVLQDGTGGETWDIEPADLKDATQYLGEAEYMATISGSPAY